MALPDHDKLHEDWGFFPLNRVPRRYTCFLGLPPTKWFGNAPVVQITLELQGDSWEKVDPLSEPKGERRTFDYCKPIPEPGFWWVGKGIWGLPTGAWHSKIRKIWKWRLSLYARPITRYDDEANYWSAPAPTVKPVLHKPLPLNP